MLEKKLIEHCSPTLAGLKTANLFNYKFSSIDALFGELQDAGQKLNEKGVYIEILRMRESRALVYVYRKRRLEKDLIKPGVQELLRKYGYSSSKLEECLCWLKQRFQESDCFPHEIGLFLDYPLSDVIGFIEQGGKNCKCCGVWKVYSNECETQALFARFRKCTEVYQRVFAGGRTLAQLTVAA
ncbi:MAG: DUF3793 family protein [Lachnospiraceae bacterium]|nr:DUF3793 family protein [Lachnospiraceae bacterium]